MNQTRRDFLKTGAAVTLSTMMMPSWLSAKTATTPNILFIISDEHRFDFCGYKGLNKIIATPSIDALAAQGVSFENHYCQEPLCVPSRMSLITSQYPYKHGVLDNDGYPYAGKATLAGYLKSRAFKTLLSGKTHMSIQGFDEVHYNDIKSYPNGTTITNAQASADSAYYSKYNASQKGKDRPAEINSLYIPYNLKEEWYDEAQYVGAADRMMSANKAGPFFMWVSFLRPHMPWQVPEPYYSKYKTMNVPSAGAPSAGTLAGLPLLKYSEMKTKGYINASGATTLTDTEVLNATRAYYGVTEFMDTCVGKTVALLDKYSLSSNTIVIYTADHGEELASHGDFFKRVFYEPCSKIPCIIKYPNVIPAGLKVTKNTEHIDLLPTLFDYCGIPPQGTEQGKSLKPLIENPNLATWVNEAYSQTIEYSASTTSNARKGYMVKKDDLKYCYYPGDAAHEELFDVAKDPGETNNLIKDPAYSSSRDALRKLLAAKFSITVGIEETRSSPAQLSNNHPLQAKYAHGAITAEVSLPRPGHVRLELLDAQGRLVQVMADGNFGLGTHTFTWNAGKQLGAGEYLVRALSGGTLLHAATLPVL